VSASNRVRRFPIWPWLGPVSVVALIGVYFVVRYEGRWSDHDSAALTEAIRVFVHEGRLVPDNGELYASGFTYQAVSTYILLLTGLDVVMLQQLL